jgi:UDP-N-acetylglucosamine 2-epimerase (non-hydrolysing)
MIVFGTRPESIKMAPVIKELHKHHDQFNYCICVTAQHKQLLDPILTLFKIKPNYDLNIMRKNQSLECITTTALMKLGEILEQEKPDYLLIQGDTTKAMVACLAAFYHKITHIEAGLRTWNKLNPYPEEINRKLINALSDLCFAHTEQAKQNLLREGIDEKKIFIIGNTVIDALLEISENKLDLDKNTLKNIPFNNKKIVLVTAHRRESFGRPLRNICIAIKEIALCFPSDVILVYQVHPNLMSKRLFIRC